MCKVAEHATDLITAAMGEDMFIECEKLIPVLKKAGMGKLDSLQIREVAVDLGFKVAEDGLIYIPIPIKRSR